MGVVQGILERHLVIDLKVIGCSSLVYAFEKRFLGFGEEVRGVSSERTRVRMRPEVLQLQTGSQIWDHKDQGFVVGQGV